MSHRPDCVEQGCDKSTKEETKREQGRVIVQAEGRRGGNREVVRKEISIRILVACGHDNRGAHISRLGMTQGIFV